MASASASEKQLVGVVGFFDDPNSILKGMEKVRDAKYRSFDAYTPYPIHGMDDAMGLKRSIIPMIVFGAGVTGFICAFGLQYWTSAVDWPINVGGKPLNSWPAFVPVMFELTILFSGITTLLSLLLFCRLPNQKAKAFDSSITRDRFAIMIDAPQNEDERYEEEDRGHKKFESSEAENFLKTVGAGDVQKVYAEGWF